MNQLILELDEGKWQQTYDYDKSVVALADRHYSRQKVGTNRATRPGKNLVLRTADGKACWASWFPKYRDDGQEAVAECTIFRNESDHPTVELIREAVEKTFGRMSEKEDGILTYIDERKVQSVNAGYSYKLVGFTSTGYSKKAKLLRLSISKRQFYEQRKKQQMLDGQLKAIFEYIQVNLGQMEQYYECETNVLEEWIKEPVQGEADLTLVKNLWKISDFDATYDWQDTIAEILKASLVYLGIVNRKQKLKRSFDFTLNKFSLQGNIEKIAFIAESEKLAVVEILREFYGGWMPEEEYWQWEEWLQVARSEIEELVKSFCEGLIN